MFGGRKGAEDNAAATSISSTVATDAKETEPQPTGKYVQFVPTWKRRRNIRRKKRTLKRTGNTKKQPSAAFRCGQKILARTKRAHLRALVTCPRCRAKLDGYRGFLRHFWSEHAQQPPTEEEKKKTEDPAAPAMENDAAASTEDEDEDKLVIDLDAAAGKSRKKKAKAAAVASRQGPVTVSEAEKAAALKSLYPANNVQTMNQKKKYVCAVCKSVCDLFGLFVHMKQVSCQCF